MSHTILELAIAERLDCRTRHDRGRRRNAELLRNRTRGRLGIARDHHDIHLRTLQRADRIMHLLAWRIVHGLQATERIVPAVGGHGRGKDTQTALCAVGEHMEDLLAHLLGQLHGALLGQVRRAVLEHDFWRALHELCRARRALCIALARDGHELAV